MRFGLVFIYVLGFMSLSLKTFPLNIWFYPIVVLIVFTQIITLMALNQNYWVDR